MSRIFVTLSAVPIILIATTMCLGWWIGDYNGPYQELRALQGEARDVTAGELASETRESNVNQQLDKLEVPRRRFKWHFMAALATALATVLTNSISITYLIGTCRWISEVCDAYGLDQGLVRKSTLLKRHTFPWSLAGMLAVLTIVALGAASDPGTLRATTGQWVLPHFYAAMVGGCVIVWAFFVQGVNLHRNAEIIESVVAEVRREREARGLDVEEAAH